LAKVILICGKICSGKTTYAKDIMDKTNAVILSVDEITLALFGQHLGEKHDEITEKTEKYLLKKTVEIISKGVNVILDWGFWTYKYRKFITNYFKELNINIEWHYVDIDKETWHKNVEKRNKDTENNLENAYFIDDNLAKKFWNIFEEPQKEEINIWIKL
jgi:predicted kinase